MHVLITGASGFLGSHIVDACLTAGYKIRAIARLTSDTEYLESLNPKIEILKGNFTDTAFIETAVNQIDCVIHAAAKVSEIGNKESFIEANITITERLLKAAKEKGVSRFVYISSPSVVAELNDQINIDESYPYPKTFLNYYCETKAFAEQKVMAANSTGFTTCSLRPRAIWGPRDLNGPFARLLKKMQQGKLRKISNGREIRCSICYVRNAAHACLLATTAHHIGGKTYFIADKETINFWAFANQIADALEINRVHKSVSQRTAKNAVYIFELLWKIPYLRKNIPIPLSKYALGILTFSSTYNTQSARNDLMYQEVINLAQAISEFKSWATNRSK